MSYVQQRERTTRTMQTFAQLVVPFADVYGGQIPIHANGTGSEQLGRLVVEGEGSMRHYTFEEITEKGIIPRATIDSEGNVDYKSDPSKNLRNALEHQIAKGDVGEEIKGAIREYLSDESRMVPDSPEVRADSVGPYLSSRGVASAHADERGVLIIENEPLAGFAEQLSQARGWRLERKPPKKEIYIQYPTISNGVHNSSIL